MPKTVFARDVAEALDKHLVATVPELVWTTAKGRQWPYAPSTRWPDQPSLDFHVRDSAEGLVIRVIHNTDANPINGEILLAAKFSTGLANGGRCIEQMASFLKNLDVASL